MILALIRRRCIMSVIILTLVFGTICLYNWSVLGLSNALTISIPEKPKTKSIGERFDLYDIKPWIGKKERHVLQGSKVPVSQTDDAINDKMLHNLLRRNAKAYLDKKSKARNLNYGSFYTGGKPGRFFTKATGRKKLRPRKVEGKTYVSNLKTLPSKSQSDSLEDLKNMILSANITLDRVFSTPEPTKKMKAQDKLISKLSRSELYQMSHFAYNQLLKNQAPYPNSDTFPSDPTLLKEHLAGSMSTLFRVKPISSHSNVDASLRTVEQKQLKNKTDAVILLTMMRSGSSIVGSLFNYRTDVTYLYEPLFPFDERPCDVQASQRVEVLRRISRCQLHKIQSLYARAFNITKRDDVNARCKVHGICFTSKTGKASRFLSRDTDLCYINDKKSQICPEPLDLHALNKHCRQSLLVAMKIIYLCKLEWLVPLLEDPNYKVKVVHLVRDPRATINSRRGSRRIKLDWVRKVSNLVCEQLEPNLYFANKALLTSKFKEKYLQVRFEDFVSNPLKKAQEIYNFVDINLNTIMKRWLMYTASTQANPKWRKKFPQSLHRNADEVLTAWRKELNFEQVDHIQKRCSEALLNLGYKFYNSSEELRNVDEFPISF